MNLIDEILRLVQEIQNTWQRFVNLVNGALSSVPVFLQWVIDSVNRLWEQVVQMWNDFWEGVSDFLSRFGDPGAVATASASWTSMVSQPAGEVAATVTTGQLSADDDAWSGDAATKYRTRAGEQQATISAIRDEVATKVVAALDGMKLAMFVFYGALIAAILALIGAIIGGLASSATIVGIPAGIVIIIGAGAIAIGAIVVAGMVFSGTADQRASEMRSAITSAKVTSWPEFVV
ncbi:hypothetical protein OCAE111667_11760 [Occultella aeris]|uniref:Uncharacterized protein n=1 Tax=Occultella aeris TaxID=2761496 RepID=A0A7M4DPV2_9MICO|nr:hypothetical protein [Occultella aeris]VZO39496.1 hypothetical protein HALOF300_04188 [Occultella aeris]